MAPKLAIWNIWVALGPKVQNVSKADHLEHLGGFGSEMIQNGTTLAIWSIWSSGWPWARNDTTMVDLRIPGNQKSGQIQIWGASGLRPKMVRGVPELIIWCIWAASSPKWAKIVTKLSIWNILAALASK